MHRDTHIFPDHDIGCYPCLATMPPGSIQICKVAFAGFVYSGRDEHKQARHEKTLTDAVAVGDASPGPSAHSSYRPMSCYALPAGP